MSQSRSARGEKRGEAHFRRLLREQESSGMSLRAFALERGMSPWTLYGWRSRLKGTRRSQGRAASREQGRLVAVDVVRGLDRESSVEVVLPGGVTVRLPREISPERLAELVGALRSC